jgi:hypothetical protein
MKIKVNNMQLTKDDVIRIAGTPDYLDFSKFQQVLEFYEKYRGDASWLYDNDKVTGKIMIEACTKEFSKDWKDSPTSLKELETIQGTIRAIERNQHWFEIWLFNYCFKDGLK